MTELTGLEADVVELLTGVYVISEDDYDPADDRADFLRRLAAWRDAAVAAERERLRTDPGGHPDGNAIEAYCATGAGDGDGRHLLQYAVRLPDGTTTAYGDQSWVSAGLGARDHDGASTVVRDIWVSYGPWRTHETIASMAAREKG